MKKFKISGVLLLIITIFLMWFILKDNFSASINIIFSANLIFILLAVLVYILYFVFETYMLHRLIKKYKPEYTFKKSLDLAIMTKFFNGITPFSTGGQPLQVYELSKDGVKATKGTIVVVEHFIVFQTSLIFLAIIAVILNKMFNIINCSDILNHILVLGFIVNTLILVVVFVASYSKNLNRKIIIFIINILAKIKLIKDKEKQIARFERICDEYYEGCKDLLHNKKNLIILLVVEIISLIYMFLFPYFIFLALGCTNINAFVCIIVSLYVFFVGSFVPIPGGTGGMEYAFMGFYAYYVDKSYLPSALIIWRFINYYCPVIIGAIFFNVRKMKDNKKIMD